MQIHVLLWGRVVFSKLWLLFCLLNVKIWNGYLKNIGMLYITFPNDYRHLDHLGLGTEQFWAEKTE